MFGTVHYRSTGYCHVIAKSPSHCMLCTSKYSYILLLHLNYKNYKPVCYKYRLTHPCYEHARCNGEERALNVCT